MNATREILQKRAAQLAREPAAAAETGGALEVVEFQLAEERYAIETAHVREVCPFKDFTPLPCVPPFVRGIMHVRGTVLAVIDLKRFFGLPERGLSEMNKVLVLRGEFMQFGILTDAIIGVRTVPGAGLQPSLPSLTGVRAEYLKGVTPEGQVILDGAKLLASKRLVIHEEVAGPE